MKINDAIAYVGEGRHLSLSPDDLLRRMDAAGIEMAAIAAVDRFLAVRNREGNKLVLDTVQKHPTRFIGMAAANPWLEKTAEEELRRALKEGARGVLLHPGYQGFRLSDPIILPLLEIVAEFGAVVYAPTGLPLIAEPLQLVEWARRFPGLTFIMGHAGASDYYADAVRALSFADNIWLESSRNGPGNYQLFEARGLCDRLVFGSSAPEYIQEVEIQVIRESIKDVAVLEKIFHRNFEEIFKLGRAP